MLYGLYWSREENIPLRKVRRHKLCEKIGTFGLLVQKMYNFDTIHKILTFVMYASILNYSFFDNLLFASAASVVYCFH